MSTVPTKFTDILAFVNGKTNSLSDTPEVDELADFANGCRENFVHTFGEDTEMVPTAMLMRTMVHLAPMAAMEEVAVTLTVLENEHRILSAPDFSHSLVGRGANSTSLVIEPLEKVVFAQAKYHNDSAALAGYGKDIRNNFRPFVVAATLKLCCIMSTVWGFFCAFEEPTMVNLYNLINDVGANRLPKDPAEQQAPLCSPPD